MRKEHIIIDSKEFKLCSSCYRARELNCFSKYSKSWDGLKSYCKECASTKGKQYRNKYREKVLQEKRKWYEQTKKKKNERTEKALKEKTKVCSRCKNELGITLFRKRANGGFYSVCRKCENKYNKEYRITHPEICKKCHVITEQRRRKKAKSVLKDLTTSEWENIKKYFDFKCAYCGEECEELTQEHVIPLSKGGNYTKSNIIPSCRSCNCKKHNKLLDEWYKNQSFYSKAQELKIKNYLNQYANTEVTI